MKNSDPPRTSRWHEIRSRRTLRAPPGSPPGTLIADPDAAAPAITATLYGPDSIDHHRISDVSEIEALRGLQPVLWVNVDGLADLDVIQRIGDMFEIHPLAREDILNVHQRAKTEEYDSNTYVVLRMIVGGSERRTEQVSIVVGTGYVVTFQEREGDCFDPIRGRLSRPGARIRGLGPGYLAYSLIDAVIDSYFPVMEQLGERVEEIEDAMILRHDDTLLPEVHSLRRALLEIRRAIWPLRDMVSQLMNGGTAVFGDQTAVYFRDCYDHIAQQIDLIENFRDQMSILIELHLSAVNMRMNEIMKILTIIATIFMPLGFLTGLYGMNFNRDVSPWNMPELGWYLGYPFALAVMVAVAGGMLLYFRRKGWIGGPRL